MAESNTRQANRAPVTLKIKFKSETLDQFIERYSVDISHGGIFIRTKDPLAVGTTLRFEFQLKDATPLIIGDGTVVWTREHDPKRAGISPGMGVRFDKLPADSQKILDRVLAKKNGEPMDESTKAYEADKNYDEEEDDDDDDDGGFKDESTRVAPAALVDSLMGGSSGSDYDKEDPTPLPKPMPFHSDAADFSEDAFEESTRVADLDAMLAHAEKAKAAHAGDNEVISSTTRPPEPELDLPEPPAVEKDPFGDLSDVDEDGRADTRAETIANPESAAAALPAAPEDDMDDRAETIAEPKREDEEESQPDDEVEGEDELAARREQADEDEDEDEDEGVATSSTEGEAVKATVLDTDDDDDDDEAGSSMRWIGVATVILIIGGAGGFWLLNKDKDKNTASSGETQEVQTAPTTTQATAPPIAPVVNEDAIKDPVKDPPKPPVVTAKLEITTVPEGAMVSVSGTELSGPSPVSFDLPEGESFTLSISHDGFLTQTVEVVADGSPIEAVTLVAMAKVVRFTSQPTGAAVTVNGRKLIGLTPIDMPLGEKLASKPSIRVRMVLAGHKALVATMPTSDEFVTEENRLVKTFAGTMVPAQIRRRPGPKKPIDPKPVNTDPKPDTDPDDGKTPPKDPDTKPDPKPEDPVDTTKPDPFKPKPDQPVPDWMK